MMKNVKKLTLIVLCTFFGISITAQNAEKDGILNKVPKKVKKDLSYMKFIPHGSYTSYAYTADIQILEKDSLLIQQDHDKRLSVASFYMSEHEVTNQQYKEFVNWVKMSVLGKMIEKEGEDIELEGMDEESAVYKKYLCDNSGKLKKELLNYSYMDYEGNKQTVNVYPDENVWLRPMSYSYNEPMTMHYFQHPAYDKYPVVGVSWKQAEAYCYWLTDRVNEKILLENDIINKLTYGFSISNFLSNENNQEYKKLLINRLRLPAEAEWEYAAAGRYFSESFKGDIKPVYPWKTTSIIDNEGKLRANIALLKDQNGFSILGRHDDGFHTIVTGHYEANAFGLYDMAGNVAEWMMDKPVLEASENKTIEARNKKVMNAFDSPRIIKGGSYLHSPVYCVYSTTAVHPEAKPASFIGFRVVMSAKEIE